MKCFDMLLTNHSENIAKVSNKNLLLMSLSFATFSQENIVLLFTLGIYADHDGR